MKKAIFFLLAALFLFINCLPSSVVLADNSGYTNSQLADVGTLMLTSLITSGEATELDFSDYTNNSGLDFLISLGELAVTGDPSGLIDQGLTWLGGELSDTYQNLIESIREWEYDVAPDLYNWWYSGTQYEYKLTPTTNISRPLVNLLQHPNDSGTIVNPDPNYDVFIRNISGLTINNCDLLSANLAYDNRTWNNRTSYSYYKVTSFDNGFVPDVNSYINMYASQPITLYINGSDSVGWSMTTNVQRVTPWAVGSNWRPLMSALYIWNSSTIDFGLSTTNYSDTGINSHNSDSLTTMFNWLNLHFRHCNIVVNGENWNSVFEIVPTYPIVIPGALTVLNDKPLVYSFPEPTYYDINGLKTLITNAINNSDVITWQDIDDYFLDINGQQALPVVQIYRNDYDNLYIEQYPYPAKLIGMQEPLTFNEHLLDNYYGQYLTPMVDVASNTIDVLPGEIKWVLGIGAILMIFAVIINRLLE